MSTKSSEIFLIIAIYIHFIMILSVSTEPQKFTYIVIVYLLDMTEAILGYVTM